MLEVNGVSRHFGGLEVLRRVDLQVPAGAIFGLIGPNGAGKTTLFNLITGLLPVSSGSISFEGRELCGLKPHQISRQGVARTFQNIRLFKEMTLLDNVLVGAYVRLSYGWPHWLFALPTFKGQERAARERALELLSWMGLYAKAHERADNLSYGEQRRLELARALAAEPRLLLLDEPVAGMNTGERTQIMHKIAEINARGYTILMIEHDMRFVMGLCQSVAVLNFGSIIACGPPPSIVVNPQVIEAYLGREEPDTPPVVRETTTEAAPSGEGAR